MKSQRQLQIGETVKRAMSDIFLRSDILTIPGSYITILEADISPDAKNAKIYIDIFGNDSSHKQIIKDLNQASGFFRHEISKKVSLKSAPQISFVLDTTSKKAIDMEALFKQEGDKINPKGSDDS